MSSSKSCASKLKIPVNDLRQCLVPTRRLFYGRQAENYYSPPRQTRLCRLVSDKLSHRSGLYVHIPSFTKGAFAMRLSAEIQIQIRDLGWDSRFCTFREICRDLLTQQISTEYVCSGVLQSAFEGFESFWIRH